VRFAAGYNRLAQLVRQDQDLTAEAGNLDEAIIGAVAKEPSRRDAGAAEDQGSYRCNRQGAPRS
jgi:hypothetical protein